MGNICIIQSVMVDIDDSRNHISGYAQAVADMVHRDMVDNNPKEWGKRPRAATGVRSKKL